MEEYKFNLRTNCPNDCNNGLIDTGKHSHDIIKSKDVIDHTRYVISPYDNKILAICEYCKIHGNQEFEDLESEKDPYNLLELMKEAYEYHKRKL